MKVAYFDCFSGISGDMILGALIELGFDLKKLDLELKKLKISGYKTRAERKLKKGISATKFSVDVIGKNTQRRLKEIVDLVDRSDLDDDLKNVSKRIFKDLATIEAKIHGKDVQEVHFHEIGGLDSIIDVTGSLIGIKTLGIEEV